MIRLSRLPFVLAAIFACKDKQPEPAPSPRPIAVADAHVAAAAPDPSTCETALAKVPHLPVTRRIQALLDGCHPCGDWTPILTWRTRHQDGGPTRAALEQAMIDCNAYCDPNAKQRFLGALDDARGAEGRAPWRVLGDMCKDKVSAVPDSRYESAAFFALDRIARDVAARPDGAKLLDAIDLPLPAVSISGSGLELPASPLVKPEAGPAQITITVTEIRIGALPHAKLGASGVTTILGSEPYPGTLVTAKDLATALAALPDRGTAPVALFAPAQMAAARVVAVVAAAPGIDVRLAAQTTAELDTWVVPGTVPIALTTQPAKGGITLVLRDSADEAIRAAKEHAPAELQRTPVTVKVEPTATVASLAKLLGALAYFDVSHVVLVAAKP